MRTLLALLLVITTHAGAAELLGRVVHVADGDTVTVLDAARAQHIVRLAGIDAPERGQAFGQVSRRHLGVLVRGQQVAVEWHKRDRYGRLVGRVVVDGRDANLTQIEAGLAWHYVAYASEQTPADRQAYSEAEQAARTQGAGLWRDREPVAPWEYRRSARRPAVEARAVSTVD